MRRQMRQKYKSKYNVYSNKNTNKLAFGLVLRYKISCKLHTFFALDGINNNNMKYKDVTQNFYGRTV